MMVLWSLLFFAEKVNLSLGTQECSLNYQYPPVSVHKVVRDASGIELARNTDGQMYGSVWSDIGQRRWFGLGVERQEQLGSLF